MRIISWNVNGIRACEKKGFLKWARRSGADLIGLQEVRAKSEQIPENILKQKKWGLNLFGAQRPGYSGVGVLHNIDPDSFTTTLGESRFDDEGRFQLLRFGRLSLANIYFPNGSGKNRDNGRIPYKLEFYAAVYDTLQIEIAKGQRVLVMGDFNTAHEEIDLARPKQNQKTSGFVPVEREELSRWLDSSFVDTFRHFNSKGDHYTWWSQRPGIRERNVGWRIDYVLASHSAMPFVERAFIRSKVMGSDHCPIGVDISDGILR